MAAPSEDDYDEFSFLEDIAQEWGLTRPEALRVARRDVVLGPDQSLSSIVWGEGPPAIAFLHGGGQNAHTWDAVLLALARPAVAIDLPGHGRSSWRPDKDYSPWKNAEAIEVALPILAPRAKAVVGMSLGGATNIRLAATRPDLVKKAVIVDVTPQVGDAVKEMTRAERGAVALVSGPSTYATFEAMAEAAIASSPNRSPAAVRRGVRHNAKRLANGHWGWRYDLFGDEKGGRTTSDFTPLWEDVSRITVPVMLVLGGDSKFVSDGHVSEMRRRLPQLRVEIVPGAGHSVQSDKPLDLARVIESFVFDDSGGPGD